jgi:hypothetical protein
MGVQHHTRKDGVDRFVPVRKGDIIDALINSKQLTSESENETFRELCKLLASIFHYEYFELLERLRNDYYYFSPEVAPHAAVDRGRLESTYADLVQSLDKVLKEANFVELPHDEIGDLHRRRTVLRVEVKAPLDSFREVRF